MMQTTQKDIIFKIIDSLMEESSWLFCSTASLEFPYVFVLVCKFSWW